jgi:hypothetical protein
MKFDRLRARMSRNLKKLENFAELIERHLRLRFNQDALAEAIAKAPPGFFAPFAGAAPVYLRHDPPRSLKFLAPLRRRRPRGFRECLTFQLTIRLTFQLATR